MRRELGKRGFGLAELLATAAILAALLGGLSFILVGSARSLERSVNRIRAVYLAQEALEVTRWLRDAGWPSSFGSWSNGIDYYPVFAAGVWSLSASPQPPVDGVFDRRLSFAPVYRDGSGNISGSGTLDPESRRVTAAISWQERGENLSLAASVYLSKMTND